MRYTTDDLISAIQKNSIMPTAQLKFGPADYKRILNERLQLFLAVDITRMEEEYFVTYADIPIVASTSLYNLPQKAMGWKIREIGWLDSTKTNYLSLERINLEGAYNKTSNQTDIQPYGFHFFGAQIATVPLMNATASGYLRVWYYREPRDLCLLTECGEITNVASVGANYNVTVSHVPSVTDGIDFVYHNEPYDTYVEELTPVLVAGNVITVTQSSFTARIPLVGDYVTSYNQSPIPQVPDIFHPLLVQYATIRVLSTTGDKNVIDLAYQDLTNMIANLKVITSARASAKARRVTNPNPIYIKM